jgi:hypothetical protein
MNVSGYSRRTSKCVIDFFPINFLSCGPAAHDKRGRQNNNTSHSQCSFFLIPGAIDRQASPPALKQTEMMRDCCSSFAHAQSPRDNECCAALGRFGRLTGSLRFPRIDETKNAFDQEQVASEQAPIFLLPLYSRIRSDRADNSGLHKINVRVVRGCFSGSA